jgi:sigma-B regulation protein RsbU (phosphoserine phosphatase)
MRLRIAVIGFFIALSASTLAAQSPAPSNAQSDIVTLLNWRVMDGDNPEWAKPEFDDSHWRASKGPVKDEKPGFQWYRTTVELPAFLRGRELGIGVGPIEEVYEVYVEGIPVGRFGHWLPQPESPDDQNMTFTVPAALVQGTTVHIAIRRWVGGSTSSFNESYASGANKYPQPTELGSLATIQDHERLHAATGILRNLPANLLELALVGAGFVAFVLFSAQRRHAEYLYLGIYCVGEAIIYLLWGVLGSTDQVMRRSAPLVLLYVLWIFFQISILLFLSRICPLFRRWLVFGAAIEFAIYLAGPYALASQSVAADRFIGSVWTYPPLILTSLAAVGLMLQRQLGSVFIALALLLQSFAERWYSKLADWLGLHETRLMPLGPFLIDIRTIAIAFLVAVIFSVLYFRYRDERLRAAGLEQDMTSARRMQEQLLATTVDSPAGFEVAAVYRPAKEVGGDFYKTELLDDGSLLIVVGDVSGKGLDAALLVAAVLGGLAIDPERRPGALLEDLNKAVLGRTGGGFITACCARLYRDGRLVTANAGHIAPYLDGKELPVEAGLPLGIAAGVSYGESSFEIADGTATWLSDGVLEAHNAEGELLGFERMAALTVKPAAEIADAAQRWGQEDDITVLTVRAVTT